MTINRLTLPPASVDCGGTTGLIDAQPVGLSWSVCSSSISFYDDGLSRAPADVQSLDFCFRTWPWVQTSPAAFLGLHVGVCSRTTKETLDVFTEQLHLDWDEIYRDGLYSQPLGRHQHQHCRCFDTEGDDFVICESRFLDFNAHKKRLKTMCCWSFTSNLCTFGLMAWNLSTCDEQCKAFYAKKKQNNKKLKKKLLSVSKVYITQTLHIPKSCLQLFGVFFRENSAEHVSPPAEDRTWSSNIDHFHKMPSWN